MGDTHHLRTLLRNEVDCASTQHYDRHSKAYLKKLRGMSSGLSVRVAKSWCYESSPSGWDDSWLCTFSSVEWGWQELKWNNNNVESSSHLVTHCMPKWWEFGQQWPSARGLALRLQSNFSEQLMSWSLRLLEMEMCTICTHQIPLKMKDLGSDRIISWSPTLNVFFYYFCKVKSNHQLQLWS